MQRKDDVGQAGDAQAEGGEQSSTNVERLRDDVLQAVRKAVRESTFSSHDTEPKPEFDLDFSLSAPAAGEGPGAAIGAAIGEAEASSEVAAAAALPDEMHLSNQAAPRTGLVTAHRPTIFRHAARLVLALGVLGLAVLLSTRTLNEGDRFGGTLASRPEKRTNVSEGEIRQSLDKDDRQALISGQAAETRPERIDSHVASVGRGGQSGAATGKTAPVLAVPVAALVADPAPTDVAVIVTQARAHIEDGRFLNARQSLRAIVSLEQPEALLLLAGTYDPAVLSRATGSAGIGDLEQALSLYAQFVQKYGYSEKLYWARMVGGSDLAVRAAADKILADARLRFSERKIWETRRLLGVIAHLEKPAAALAMAQTYDPNALGGLVDGKDVSDRDEAEKWYRRWHAYAVRDGELSGGVNIERLIRSMQN